MEELQPEQLGSVLVSVPLDSVEAIVKLLLLALQAVQLKIMVLMTYHVRMVEHPKELSETANASVLMDIMEITVKMHQLQLVHLEPIIYLVKMAASPN